MDEFLDAKMSIPDRIATCASMSSITRFCHKSGQAAEDVALTSLLSMGKVLWTAWCSCMRANDGMPALRPATQFRAFSIRFFNIFQESYPKDPENPVGSFNIFQLFKRGDECL